MESLRQYEMNRSIYAANPTPSKFLPILLGILLLLGLSLFRFYAILPRRAPSRTSRRTQPCHLAVFLGSGIVPQFLHCIDQLRSVISGGHTSEAISLVSALDFSRYSPRTYIISQGDNLSAKKASALELLKASEYPSHPVSRSSYAYKHLRCQTDIWGSL